MKANRLRNQKNIEALASLVDGRLRKVEELRKRLNVLDAVKRCERKKRDFPRAKRKRSFPKQWFPRRTKVTMKSLRLLRVVTKVEMNLGQAPNAEELPPQAPPLAQDQDLVVAPDLAQALGLDHVLGLYVPDQVRHDQEVPGQDLVLVLYVPDQVRHNQEAPGQDPVQAHLNLELAQDPVLDLDRKRQGPVHVPDQSQARLQEDHGHDQDRLPPRHALARRLPLRLLAQPQINPFV